jgi:hypothetical protein
MTPVRVFPDVEDPFACSEIECEHLEGRTLRECERARCCFAFQRSREEAAIDQARRDEKEKMRDDA